MFTKRISNFILAIIASAAILGSTLPASAANPIPKRIISLSPSATETLFAIGAGKQVIAVDDLSNYPSNAPITKLSAFSPNVEALLNYPPQLVLLLPKNGLSDLPTPPDVFFLEQQALL